MRKIWIFILLFPVLGLCQGFDSTITHYNLYVYQIVDTTIVPDTAGYFNYEFPTDTVIVISWTQDTVSGPQYVQRYNVFLARDTIHIPNTTSLWGVWDGTQMVNPDTAYAQERFILHTNRWYEITISGVYVWRSGTRESAKGKQFYIRVPKDIIVPEERAFIIIDIKVSSVPPQ